MAAAFGRIGDSRYRTPRFSTELRPKPFLPYKPELRPKLLLSYNSPSRHGILQNPRPRVLRHEKSRLRWAGPALRGFEAFGYLLAPMRQMVVPQSGHLPFVMGLPFFVVLSTGSCITFFALHFTQ